MVIIKISRTYAVGSLEIYCNGCTLKSVRKRLLKIQFVLCIENNGCEDIEKRKFYQILPDEEAAREGYLRVVDESQEDYLYPESYFIFVELPCKVQEAFVAIG